MLGDAIYPDYLLNEGKIARMQVASPASDAKEKAQIPRRRFSAINKASILDVYDSDLAIEFYRISPVAKGRRARRFAVCVPAASAHLDSA